MKSWGPEAGLLRSVPGLQAATHTGFSSLLRTEFSVEAKQNLYLLLRGVVVCLEFVTSLMLLGKLLYFPWHFQLFAVGRIVRTSQPIFSRGGILWCSQHMMGPGAKHVHANT